LGWVSMEGKGRDCWRVMRGTGIGMVVIFDVSLGQSRPSAGVFRGRYTTCGYGVQR
jgi:hypothetical protein